MVIFMIPVLSEAPVCTVAEKILCKRLKASLSNRENCAISELLKRKPLNLFFLPMIGSGDHLFFEVKLADQMVCEEIIFLVYYSFCKEDALGNAHCL